MLKHYASLALLITLAITPASFAQDTALQQFEVELVIFRVAAPSGSPEDWALEELRAKSSLPATRDTEELATPGTGAAATTLGSDSSIQPLESGHLKLAAIEGALKRNHSYQPLAHIGWTQPGFALTSPRPLGIENLVPRDTGISGTVTLTRGKYLHMVLDLTWQSPDGKRYVLREQRKMRSGEKHYFDHPYFGVIALVTPRG